MNTILILNASVVNEGKQFFADIFIRDERIERIGNDLGHLSSGQVIDAKGKVLFPGVIDDQVHFREPGLTHKATIYSEARAAVAGGVTSFMEMPNTVPNTLTQTLLEDKYQVALNHSLANYSFYMGASNDNLEEVLKTDPQNVCGVKVFMGSSTGNMLVDDAGTLAQLFSRSNMLIATHCEDEQTIRDNLNTYRSKYGEDIPFECHPEIRSAEACYKSSSLAVKLARKHGTRLHILHISTAREVGLFGNELPLKDKMITAEACVHHLWFDDMDYAKKGSLIKWNPAVKSAGDREAILKAVLEDKIDVIATDHAPHTLEEKQQKYLQAPSGGPLVQHGLLALLDLHHQGKISLEKIAEKMSHSPATLFKVSQRGFIREGYFADLVLVDLDGGEKVDKSNILYKCGWSPFEGHTFTSRITHTIVSGHLAYREGVLDESRQGRRLTFER